MSKELIERLLDNRVTGFNLTVAAVEAADLIEAQAAQIEILKTAIKDALWDETWWRVRAKKVLETQPNEALQAFAEKVRDQCAHIIEAQDVDPSFKHRMADAIRSITELPK